MTTSTPALRAIERILSNLFLYTFSIRDLSKGWFEPNEARNGDVNAEMNSGAEQEITSTVNLSLSGSSLYPSQSSLITSTPGV